MVDPNPVPVSHADHTDTCTIASRIAVGKTALQRAWEKRDSYWQNCEALLLKSMREFEACEKSLSASDQDTGRQLCGLVLTLLRCYDSTIDQGILVEAIALGRESLSFCTSGHSYRAKCCFRLARALRSRYESTGDLELLTEAIDLERESLALRPPGHPGRAHACEKLASSLRTRYKSTSDDQLLIEAINLQQESLALRPPGHPDRAHSCGNLASSLQTRYMSTGDDRLMTEAIDLKRESLALRPPGHPNRSHSCASLATSLQTHYDSTGDHELLSEAIDLERESLALRPPGHPGRAHSCSKLASSLRTRYLSTSDDRILTEAINLERESLALRPPGHPDRAHSCTSLAISLRTRYKSTGDDRLLNEAIDLERELLTLHPPGHPDRAHSCASLAISLWMRYNSTGDDRLLTESIDLKRESLAFHPPGHPDRAFSCASLAISLWTCYNSTGDDQFLTEAIDLERESLALRPPGHTGRAGSYIGLACSLWTLYNSTHNIQLLMHIIDLERESLSIYPPGHPNREISCANLAKSLRTSYIKTGESALIDEIHGLCLEGLSLSPTIVQWAHAHTLVWLHIDRKSRFRDLQLAIKYLSQCFETHPNNVSEAIETAIDCLSLFWDHNSDLQLEHNAALIAIYGRIIRLLPFISNPIIAVSSQLQALRKCNQLGSDAFANAVLAGQWAPGVEDLELVQGLCWTQYLYYRDPQLDDIPPELAARLQHHLNAINASSTTIDGGSEVYNTSLTLWDAQHSHVTHVYELLREIRALPGLDRFMLGETFNILRSVASSHPVVVLVGARGHFYALVLNCEHAECMLLSLAISKNDFRTMSSTAYINRSHRGYSTASEGLMGSESDRGLGIKRLHPSSTASSHMRCLWLKIVQPVLDRLGFQPSTNHVRPRLHWYPTGDFTSLPLHAAGIYDGPVSSRACCADYVISSYTPTLTTLLRAQKAASSLRTDAACITLVAEKQAHELHLQVIHEVDAEVNNVSVVATSRHVKSVERLPSPVTIAETCAAMQTANIIHLACHGIQDPESTVESGFCLGDGRLTISKLMEMRLENPFLAFLSACETAKGDQNQPDQVMHLAAAMMFLGFKAVVATMWAIADEDGPKVAKWFYEELFAHDIINGDTVAYALDTAVGRLRDSGVPLERWAPFIHMGV